MSGKPCGCVGKPKQDLDWRAKSTKGHLLPQSWVAVAVCGHGLKTVYKLLQQNKTKQNKKPKKKKKERRKDSGTKTTFIVFYSLLTQAWFTPNFRSVVGKSNSLSLPVSLLFLSCALCMWRLKCRTHCVCCCCCARARLTNESQLMKRNRKRKYRCFLKMFRSFMAITKNPSRGQPGPATSMFLWGQTSCYADPSALRQGNSKCVYLIICYLCFCFWSLHSFMRLKKKERRFIKHFVCKVDLCHC